MSSSDLLFFPRDNNESLHINICLTTLFSLGCLLRSGSRNITIMTFDKAIKHKQFQIRWNELKCHSVVIDISYQSVHVEVSVLIRAVNL